MKLTSPILCACTMLSQIYLASAGLSDSVNPPEIYSHKSSIERTPLEVTTGTIVHSLFQRKFIESRGDNADTKHNDVPIQRHVTPDTTTQKDATALVVTQQDVTVDEAVDEMSQGSSVAIKKATDKEIKDGIVLDVLFLEMLHNETSVGMESREEVQEFVFDTAVSEESEDDFADIGAGEIPNQDGQDRSEVPLQQEVTTTKLTNQPPRHTISTQDDDKEAHTTYTNTVEVLQQVLGTTKASMTTTTQSHQENSTGPSLELSQININLSELPTLTSIVEVITTKVEEIHHREAATATEETRERITEGAQNGFVQKILHIVMPHHDSAARRITTEAGHLDLVAELSGQETAEKMSTKRLSIKAPQQEAAALMPADGEQKEVTSRLVTTPITGGAQQSIDDRKRTIGETQEATTMRLTTEETQSGITGSRLTMDKPKVVTSIIISSDPLPEITTTNALLTVEPALNVTTKSRKRRRRRRRVPGSNYIIPITRLQTSRTCPQYYTAFSESSDSCYRFNVNSAASWSEAGRICTSQNGRLLVLDSTEKREWLESTLVTKAWIGLSRNDDDGRYRWVNGVYFEHALSGRWLPGEPNSVHGGDKCIEYRKEIGVGIGMSDVHCENSLPFICETSKLTI